VTGATDLHFATNNVNPRIILHLVSEGSDVEAKDDKGATPLHWAIEAARSRSVGFLLQAGASVTATDDEGATPLHLIVESENFYIIHDLLDEKADVHAKDSVGKTPLQMATEYYKLMKSTWQQARIHDYEIVLRRLYALGGLDMQLDIGDGLG